MINVKLQQFFDQEMENIEVDDFDQQYRIDFQQVGDWKAYLKENGFVVVSNVLSQQMCQKYVNQFWEIMQKLARGKLNKNDLTTHSDQNNYPPLLHGGMLQYIGHSKPQWQLRQKCKVLFEKLWNTNDLKTSFDGFCFMNGLINYQPRPDNQFLHTDQSPMKDFLWSYQGIMNLMDTGTNGGGFVCVPKSHKYHQQFFTKIGRLQHKNDWFAFSQKQKYEQPLCNTIKVNSKAGDFILFDSRTFHCNTVPTNKKLRVCTYICMLPKQKISQQILQLRKLACKNIRTTSHHPGSGFRTFPELPKTKIENSEDFLRLVKEVNDFQLSQEMRNLV